MSSAKLVREGGEQELRIADAELIGAAKREGLERRENGRGTSIVGRADRGVVVRQT